VVPLRQVIDGWRHFGYHPMEGENDEGMGRGHREEFLEFCGKGFAQPNPRSSFPIRRACFVKSPTPKDCVFAFGGGAASNATAVWAAKLGMNLQSSGLKFDETGERSVLLGCLTINQRLCADRAPWRAPCALLPGATPPTFR